VPLPPLTITEALVPVPVEGPANEAPEVLLTSCQLQLKPVQPPHDAVAVKFDVVFGQTKAGPLKLSQEGGGKTADAASCLSWLPPPPSIETSRVWKGEPLILKAELPEPQSTDRAMCPPQAKITLELVVAKTITSRVSEELAVKSPRLPSALFV
jgi:hypothetical protein